MKTPCPYCTVVIHGDKVLGGDIQETKGGLLSTLRVCGYACPNCDGRFVTVEGGSAGAGERIVHPLRSSRRPAPEGTPEHLRKDYDEACNVLSISPKSAAALARRMLQAILRDPNAGNVQGKANLHHEILALSNGPPIWAEYLDLIRGLGNLSAHPTIDAAAGAIVEVEQHEAEITLDIVEALLVHYYVSRVKLEKAKTDLAAKKATV